VDVEDVEMVASFIIMAVASSVLDLFVVASFIMAGFGNGYCVVRASGFIGSGWHCGHFSSLVGNSRWVVSLVSLLVFSLVFLACCSW
jgi:hypothetical protein